MTRDIPEAGHLPGICCREHAAQAAAVSVDAEEAAEQVRLVEAVEAEIDGLRAALERADRWIIARYSHEKDHACAECVPGGPIVVPGFQCVFHEAVARAAPSEPKQDWVLVPEDWDPHALDDQHPCLVCGGVTSHDHSVAEWKAALQALAPNKWAHTAKNDPAGLYDDNWEPKTSTKEDQS